MALTLQRYTHAVSRDRMVATGKMLSAILSHAPDKKRNDSGLDRKTVQEVLQGHGPMHKSPGATRYMRTESGLEGHLVSRTSSLVMMVATDGVEPPTPAFAV